MEHWAPEPNHKNHKETLSESFLDEDNILADELKGLHTLADNSIEDWPNHRSRMIEHNLAKMTSNTTHFSHGWLFHR